MDRTGRPQLQIGVKLPYLVKISPLVLNGLCELVTSAFDDELRGP
jgi:hypothetical protein